MGYRDKHKDHTSPKSNLPEVVHWKGESGYGCISMTSELLREAYEQAESESAVKAAALLHLARVFAGFDQPEAESSVEAGIALTHQRPKFILLEEAEFLAASVSPKQALAAHASIREKQEGPDNPVDHLIINMVTHDARSGSDWLFQQSASRRSIPSPLVE